MNYNCRSETFGAFTSTGHLNVKRDAGLLI